MITPKFAQEHVRKFWDTPIANFKSLWDLKLSALRANFASAKFGIMDDRKTLNLLEWAESELTRSGIETARRETELLLCHCAGTGKEEIFPWSVKLDSRDIRLFRRYVRRRATRYPLQYILKKIEFMGLPLEMQKGVFIPRPETELLVEKVQEVLSDMNNRAVNILEIGTGSGNIAISLTRNVTNCRIIASDISDTALGAASRNAKINAVSEKIKFIKSDLFSNIPGAYSGHFDMIISNPPYVKRREIKHLQPEISHEDIKALDGGGDGLDFYRSILDNGRQYLKDGGIFAFEIGYDQREAVTKIAKGYPGMCEMKSFKDYNGHDRIILTRFKRQNG